MTTLAVIPARYAATRLPGKPLADIHGKPLIQWVVERARTCRHIDRVIVATDDRRIYDAVLAFGGEARMTSPDCNSGSDRIAEVIRTLPCDLVVNIQGDEPMIATESVNLAVEALLRDSDCPVSTAKVAIYDRAEYESPHAVKVVTDARGYALYFSRSPIPNRIRTGPDAAPDGKTLWGYKHLGLYVYRRQALLDFVSWPPSPLEQTEKLEQLRYLDHGYRIRVVETPFDSVGVDTPEDLERVRALLSM
ncbi:MAG: 3-deoxy-manno-octulosonate cytidylyltransferase [Candidatus Sumerlaeia bacterium]|nr:3-deoxy-manno-octulosonate cytidylyltransferase [Candidatus Sumerlaeia bacterium]